MEIGFVTAFIGGILALLSPCSALLLPAFFASTLGTRMQLLVHGSIFYLGLVITLVPFGLGLGALGTLFLEQRGLVIAVTSAVLILLGIMQALGFGFDLSRALPGAAKLQQGASQRKGFVRTLLLGAVSGVAGFCAGPILGAVLTLALGQGSVWSAGTLLAVYGAGMVAPLVIIAAAWEKLGARGQRFLRGRSITIFGRSFHLTSLITGILIVGVGLLFWFTNGLVSMPSLVPTEVQLWAQQRGAVFSSPIFDAGAILLLMILALALWARAQRKKREAPAEERHETHH